jgi:hypothetical protein
MTLELSNATTFICRKYSREFLGKALKLAYSYGWRPQGTCPPTAHDFRSLNAEWNGTYLTNDGQVVAREDALFLAQALEKALIEDGLAEYSPDLMEIHPFEFFAGAEKQHLMELIRFCRLGSFTII